MIMVNPTWIKKTQKLILPPKRNNLNKTSIRNLTIFEEIFKQERS